MSLKKRMFRSNMMILFLSLLSLLAVVFLVLILFEDRIERRFFTMGQSKLDTEVLKAVSLVDHAGTDDIETLEQEMEPIGYQTALIREEQIQAGSTDEQMLKLAQALDTEYLQKEQSELFYYRNATVVVKYIPQENACIVSAHFAKVDFLKTSLLHSSRTLLWVLILISAGVVIVLLILSSYFTKRMNRVVMEPLEELVKGAERISQGNLKEDIRYHGEKEFEDLCLTFNSMQKTILADQERRQKTEQSRIDMVTGISHDLRTPLTSIQGYIKGVIDGVADSSERRQLYLKTAYESTEDMNQLLQKLFDFSRLESGQMPFHMVRVDLCEFVNTCIAQRETVLDAEKLQFFFESQEQLPEILLDIQQFGRIFDNLLENSMKYTNVCPVKIQVRVFNTEESVCLEWKDNGPGVPEEKIGRIFDRFYRCDGSRKQKGSGVGLYVVKYIIERHGGCIWAENDSGLKLTLTFPKAEEE